LRDVLGIEEPPQPRLPAPALEQELPQDMQSESLAQEDFVEGHLEDADHAETLPETVDPVGDAAAGFIVVMQVGGQIFGIVVDGVFHTEEIVVKPMSSLLRSIATFSGNTILGDGSVIMIIDPNGIAQSIQTELSETNEAKSDAAHEDAQAQ
jgi:two-component system chemotaxis sensor kinase CheA